MSERIHVIVQYCNDPRPARAAEYDECFRRNLASPHVRAVHNLVEPATIVPLEFKSHPKYHEHIVPRWLRYSDAFAYANEHLDGRTCCLCNLDIFLDPASDWAAAAETVKQEIVLALSRTEFDIDGRRFLDPKMEKLAYANSQDAWVFRAPFDVPNCDFALGTIGCDNAIAHRIRQTSRLPINAASRFRILHYDRARGKTLSNQRQIHESERRQSAHPEREGQYLLPDIDKIKSIDKLLDTLKASEVARYEIICEALNRLMKIENL